MTPENPSAFPLNPTNDGTPGAFCPEPGMTLRDYFAGQALAGVMANAKLLETITKPEQTNFEAEATIAATAYRLADAMLAARKGEPA